MPFLVERVKSADGCTYPDYDDYRDGIVVWEGKELAAIRTYGRKVLGGESKILEGDEFCLTPLGEPKTHKVTSRRINLKITEVE